MNDAGRASSQATEAPFPVPWAERNLRHVKTLTSAVTTAWGVNWDEPYIARDIMQNFFDANRDRLNDVVVLTEGTKVTITAPASFNLERLFYLGSEKGPDDIGQYGEGFKVAATCLLRDHAVDIVVASGNDVLRLRIATQAVSDTKIYPIEYDFFQSDHFVVGTLLELHGCSKRLNTALQQGLNHFFHGDNPLLGVKRWEHYSRAFSIYDSTDGNGHVFYRKLKRGQFDGIPIVVVIDKEYAAIEKKISKDRDRNAFGEQIMRLFFQFFSRNGLRNHNDAIQIVVLKAQNTWVKGHPLLSEIATTLRYHPWSSAKGRTIFGDGYYAKAISHDIAKQMQFDQLERTWRQEGKTCLPQYAKQFGVLNAETYLDELHAAARAEVRKQEQRAPSSAETAAILVLTGIMRELAPDVAAVFDRSQTSYTVAQTETILGELRTARSYRSREVFLSGNVFLMDFAQAIAIFLHEHAHIFGHDGHRGFTDALTGLLETVVRHRTSMDAYEEQWEIVKKNVMNERTQEVPAPDQHADWLSGKTESELRALLRRVPPGMLRKLKSDDRQS